MNSCGEVLDGAAICIWGLCGWFATALPILFLLTNIIDPSEWYPGHFTEHLLESTLL